jgi:hypothetical protein
MSTDITATESVDIESVDVEEQRAILEQIQAAKRKVQSCSILSQSSNVRYIQLHIDAVQQAAAKKQKTLRMIWGNFQRRETQ